MMLVRLRSPKWVLLLLAAVTVNCKSDPKPQVSSVPYAEWESLNSKQGTTVTFGPPQTLLKDDGLLLQEQRWHFDDDFGLAWRVRLDLPGQVQVRPSSNLEMLGDFEPDDDGPWAVINGGFYDGIEDPSPLGLVVSDGQTHSKLSRGGGSGIFQVVDAEPAIIRHDTWHPGATEALQSVDRLVDRGKSLVANTRPKRDARSAVALTDDHLWLVVLASSKSARKAQDGVHLVNTTKHGLPLYAFADYLVDSTGADTALNLDGAVSTQLTVRASRKVFRVHGERGVINALEVRPGKTPR